MLDTTGTGLRLPAGSSPASLTLRQDEGVGALAMLDPVQASVAVTIAAGSAAAAAAAATCAAALRPPPLLRFFAARDHQKCCQREPALAKAAPQHHIRLQVTFTLFPLGRLLCCCGFELPLMLDQTRPGASEGAPSMLTQDLWPRKLLQTWTRSSFLKVFRSVSLSEGLQTSLTGMGGGRWRLLQLVSVRRCKNQIGAFKAFRSWMVSSDLPRSLCLPFLICSLT